MTDELHSERVIPYRLIKSFEEFSKLCLSSHSVFFLKKTKIEVLKIPNLQTLRWAMQTWTSLNLYVPSK